MSEFKYKINEIWDNRDNISALSSQQDKLLDQVLLMLDQGKIRIAEKQNGEWHVNSWIKEAILLSFRFRSAEIIKSGISLANAHLNWYDKVGLKFYDWQKTDYENAQLRAVPPAFVRKGAYIGRNVVLMPSYVNIGAYIDDGCLIDTWATVGSCAQIGKNCHISGGVGIGGVLEPMQALPVIIEDNCFIGARSEIAEGVIIGEGSVISMGVFLGTSTKILDRETGELYVGKVPPYSVVVPGTMPDSKNSIANLYCAVIVKKVDSRTREKTSLNELLRY